MDSIVTQSRLSLVVRLAGLIVAAGLAIANVAIGINQGMQIQLAVLTGLATLAITAWVWRFLALQFVPKHHLTREDEPTLADEARNVWRNHKYATIAMGILAAGFAILSISVAGFFNIFTVISATILLSILVLTLKYSHYMLQYRSSFIGLMVLAGLFSVGAMTVEGFSSSGNVRSMLIFAAFLGLACTGQTLVALVGGLDLSIPFVIGSANVGLSYILSLGVPSSLAFAIVIVAAGLIGLLNGALSFKLQGQALIMSLGVGFAVAGATQIATIWGAQHAGSLYGPVPEWLSNMAAMNGTTMGMHFPAVILIWIVLGALVILALKFTVYGRYLYAMGVNRTSARRVNISERRYWYGVHVISGVFSGFTGALLLGWSGGGFIGIGDPYLFMTIAAVVVGGTSLLGGVGGYGFTVIGVLVLQVLTSFLVGIGLDFEWQQFVFGLLILPMVALYARSPHIRTQI